MSSRSKTSRRQRQRNSSKINQIKTGEIVNPYPPLEILPKAKIEMIHATAMRIVSELGLKFQDAQALEILHQNGATVNFETGMVQLSPEKLLENIGKVPSEFTLHSRNPDKNVTIGGNRINLSPVSGPPKCF